MKNDWIMQQNQLIALILVGALVMGGAIVVFTAGQDDDDFMEITVTLAWQKEMVEWIGGDNVKATHMVRPGQDPHVPEGMTPAEVIAAAKSDAYIYIGAGMSWERTHLSTIEAELPDLKMFKMSEGVDLIPRGAGNDSHVWTLPDNLLIMANNTKNALIEIDPENEASYTKGYESYFERVNEIKVLADEKLGGAAGNEFLVFHSAWQYLANEYDLVEVAVQNEFGTDLTPSKVASWIDDNHAGLDRMYVRPHDPVNDAAFADQEIEVVIMNPLALNWLDELEKFIYELEGFWETA